MPVLIEYVQRYWDPDERIDTRNGISFLEQFAKSGNSKAASFIKKRQDAAQADRLCYAASGGRVEVVRELLSAGVDPNIKKEGGNTALAAAAECAKHEVVKLLLEHGANVELAGPHGTPLFYAVRDHPGRIQVEARYGAEAVLKTVQVLVANGANVNSVCAGRPLLQWAVASCSEPIIRLLLDAGANPDNAIEWAIKKGREDLLNLLMKYGWAKQLTAQKDYAALAAIMYEYNDQSFQKDRVVQMLLTKAGADAIEGILQQITSHGICPTKLAEVLVQIGDARAAGVLKPYLLRGEFRGQTLFERGIEKFISKFDGGLQEEINTRQAAKQATTDARLTALLAAKGAPLREYCRAYIFRPRTRNKVVFDSLRATIERGKEFPLDAPHQIALINGPEADFIAVLVRLPTEEDMSLEVHRRVLAWFAEAKAGKPDDHEYLRLRPHSDRLSQGLRYISHEYSVLEIIDNLESSDC